jgi:hypothetical protein
MWKLDKRNFLSRRMKKPNVFARRSRRGAEIFLCSHWARAYPFRHDLS